MLWESPAVTQGDGSRAADPGVVRDPRINTFAAAIRRGRWRHSAAHKRYPAFVRGRRMWAEELYPRGDLRHERLVRTRWPSMARRLLRHDIPATYDTDSPWDLPDWIKPSSGLTMLPGTADHE